MFIIDKINFLFMFQVSVSESNHHHHHQQQQKTQISQKFSEVKCIYSVVLLLLII